MKMTAQELNTEFVEVKDAAYRYAASLLHSRSEAEDIVQDLYEKLWRRRLLVRKKGFVQLVMVSTRNMCMDVFRRRNTDGSSAEFIEGMEAGTGDAGIWSASDGERGCREEMFWWEEEKERQDMAAIAGRLISRLPQREREAVHLRLVEEMDYQMIAQIMGINESAARMACSRGRSKVKDELVKIMGYGTQKK